MKSNNNYNYITQKLSIFSAFLILKALFGTQSALAQENASGKDAILDLSLADLQTMEVTTRAATRSIAISIDEAPSIIYVITREEIDMYGYRSIGEALASVPGLFVIDDLVTSNVGIRGINGGADSWSRIMKFMIDGKSVHYYTTGGVLLGPEFIPMSAVEAIEVIGGPGSAMYGANAFLGVVNIVTKTLEDGFSGLLGGEMGMNRTKLVVGGDVLATGTFFKKYPLSLTGAFAASRIDRSGLEVPQGSPAYDAYSGLESEDDLSKPISALCKLVWDAKRAGQFELFTSYQRLDAYAEFSSESVLSHENHYLKTNRIARFDYRVSLFDFAKKKKVGNPASFYDLFKGKHVYTNTVDFHAWAGATKGHPLEDEVLDVGSPTFNIHRNRNNLTFEVGGEFTYQLELSSLLVGIDFQSTKDDGDEIVEINNQTGHRASRGAPESLEYENMGVFAQAILYPFRQLGLAAGMRYDNSSQWGTNVSMRFGAVGRIIDGLYLKALYGTSFVPPAPSQLGAVPLELNGGVQGNPNLESQSAQTPEAAIIFSYWKLLGLQLSVFYTKIENRVEFVQNGLFLTADNLSESTSVGGTFSADFKWKFFFSKADISLIKTEIQDPDNPSFTWQTVYGDDIEGERRSPNFPGVLGHLNLGVRFPEYHFQLAILGAYVGDRKSSYANINENRESYLLDPYFTLGANVRTLGLHLIGDRETVISLQGCNLTNSQYSHGGASGTDIPAMGVSAFLKLSQEI
ncbi:MAG: TonB-dependent receptor [Deltaproteobacteria bacterium]|nr:TonB-dependent receptor [Deltaproteobacteria bacterium]